MFILSRICPINVSTFIYLFYFHFFEVQARVTKAQVCILTTHAYVRPALNVPLAWSHAYTSPLFHLHD